MALRKRARANVVSLRGAAVPGSREPDPRVVSKIEELLRQARGGEVHGLAYVVIRDQYVATGWEGRADSHRMLAGAALLNYRIAKDLDGA